MKTERRGAGVTISVNENTEYTAGVAGTWPAARPEHISRAAIGVSDLQFSPLSNAVN